eukprot:jgi/Psemu1/58366/gm1.58366_g
MSTLWLMNRVHLLRISTPNDEATLRDAFHASLGLYKAASQPNSRPLKSSVSPAHLSRFLADNPEVHYKKDGNTYVPVGSSSLSASFHKWYIPNNESSSPIIPSVPVYHSNQTAVSKPGYAMVDRGANGCIIGNDACCLISKDIIPPRYVNVTGIHHHQIQNIPIATCSAYAFSNWGPVIVTSNEWVYTGQHASILSYGQMESYFST